MHSTVALHMELALALYGSAEELYKICYPQSLSHSSRPHRVLWSTRFLLLATSYRHLGWKLPVWALGSAATAAMKLLEIPALM